MKKACNILIYLLALPRGIEPLTKNLEGSCSIILPFTANYHILLFLKVFLNLISLTYRLLPSILALRVGNGVGKNNTCNP